MNLAEQAVPPGLHFVAVPIGNARDITLRALDILAGAEVLAAEDTRSLRRLLEIHGIALGGRKLLAYHDHSGPAARERLIEALRRGRSVAYASEAGTPLLADPGFALGRAALAEGLPVTAAPGPSALLAALTVAGLPTDVFTFAGFLPAAPAQRRARAAELGAAPGTLVLYESPRRLAASLADLAAVLGEARPAAVARELTKRFEEVRRGSLGSLAGEFADAEVKGEVVVLIGAAPQRGLPADEVEAALKAALGSMRVKDAATAVAGAMGLPRRDVYQLALRLAAEGRD